MKAIDVFYLEHDDISCITVQRTDIVAGQKIIDENRTIFEVYGLVPNGRGLLNGISSLLVHGKFEGNIVNLVDEPKGVTNEN